jgi:hypothetical protein
MRVWPKRFNLARSIYSLVGGLLLTGLLTACWEVNTYVQVENTCSPGSPRVIPSPEPGACSVINPYTGPLLPANYKVCKDVTGATITCTGNENCTSGNRCNDAPGSQNRKVCKTVWTQSAAGSMNGACNCSSNY